MLSFQALRSKLAFLCRFVAIIGLLLLAISLLVPDMDVLSMTASAFQSPGTSPPDTSPPDTSPPDTSPPDTSPPDKSPPGPFKSPPGQFKSPPYPGGRGDGLGPVRHINLQFYPNSMVYAPDASGKITIFGTYNDKDDNWMEWPPSVEYSVSKLPCLDFEHVADDGWSGERSYALYLITESGERYRIQTFNPGCYDKNFKSWAIVRDIPEEVLLSQDIAFEIHFEIDEGMHAPDYGFDFTLVLSGTDLVD